MADRAEAKSPPHVSFRRPTGEEYATWAQDHARSYALDKIALGHWPAGEAERWAREEADRLLASEGHALERVLASDDTPVGWFWSGPWPDGAEGWWIYDISIDAPHRRQGFARAILRTFARRHPGERLGLNVFSHNIAARHLYDGEGWVAVDSGTGWTEMEFRGRSLAPP
ncbi:MAG: GNAT family N-acetyltransferase [Thermoplasmatota archaeon]